MASMNSQRNCFTYYMNGGTELCYEYNGQIDFRNCEKHSKWRIATIIPESKLPDFQRGLFDRGLQKSFNYYSKTLPSGTNVWISFYPLRYPKGDVGQDRRALLRWIVTLKTKIIWKESFNGYEIDDSGNIKRKWKLDKAKQLALDY